MSAFAGSPDRHTIHLLLTHVGEENITWTPAGRWACWDHHFPQRTSHFLDQLASDDLIAINDQGVAFLTYPQGLDMLIRLNDEAGIPQ